MKKKGSHLKLTTHAADAAADFDPLRPRLMRVAYRMLGSVSEAEDMVQEAFIRWMETDRSQVRTPEAFLRQTVTRLCLDQLKSARHRRETYIGPWLPEPVVQEDKVEDVTLPLMLALERLTPLERAAFLLHDVFGLAFNEVAVTIERSEAACRQLAARGRAHVRETRTRFEIDKERGLAIAEAFFAASQSGDVRTLKTMLADDVGLYADGGGKRPAVTVPVLGLDALMKLYENFPRNVSTLVQVGFINGLPGYVTLEPDGELQTIALEIGDEKIRAIYAMRNPDKLRHLH